MTNIYERALKEMNPADIDHHEGDLYLRVNEISTKLVNEYEYKGIVTRFVDNIDHVLWYEIPFGYFKEEKG